MDYWIARIFAIGVVAVVVCLIWLASQGNDGAILYLISGIVTGMFAKLGITGIFQPEKVSATSK